MSRPRLALRGSDRGGAFDTRSGDRSFDNGRVSEGFIVDLDALRTRLFTLN